MAKPTRRPKRPPEPRVSDESSGFPPRWLIGGVTVAVLLVGGTYYFRPPAAPQDTGTLPVGNGIAPKALLQRVAEKYRTMSSYAERVEVHIQLPREGRITEDVTVAEMAAQLPNQFALKVTHLERRLAMGTDGREAVVTVSDPETDNFEHQFVRRPAPPQIDLAAVYEAAEYTDVSRPNELLSLLSTFSVDLQVSPMGLVLGSREWDSVIEQAKSVSALPEMSVDGVPCHRIRIELAAGDIVIHIAKDDLLIRRIDYPVAPLLAPDVPVELRTRASHISKHTQLRVNEALPAETFVVPPPVGGRRMRHFVMPFREAAPVVLKTRPTGYAFTNLQGQPVDATEWSDRIAVLVWFGDHPASQAVVTQVDRVRAQLADAAEFAFYAICSEPPTEKSHADIENLVRNWKLSLPVVRDMEAVGRDLFDVKEAPTLVILDPSGSVQLFEVGANPVLQEQLPIVLEELQSGKDIATDYLQYVSEQRTNYEQLLASSSWDAPTAAAPIAEAVIAPRSEPERFAMERAWRSRELPGAGNVLAVPSALDEWHFIVNTAWDQIAVLDTAGKIVKQVRLAEGEEEVLVSYLRSTTNRIGERFYVGCAALGKTAYVLDARFQRIVTYPPHEFEHPGIHDVWLTDIDGDDALELYVGFGGPPGLHSVDLQGNRRWENQSVTPVLSLSEVTSRDQRTLLATGAGGQIDRFDKAGQKLTPVMVGQRAIHHIFASGANELRPTQLCGLASLPSGQLVAVGLSPHAEEAWNYPLPKGSFGSQIRFVRSGQVFSDSTWDWIVAGPDGSIHILADDGQQHDAFHYGKRLQGIETVRIGDRALLIVATDEGVDAWWLTPK